MLFGLLDAAIQARIHTELYDATKWTTALEDFFRMPVVYWTGFLRDEHFAEYKNLSALAGTLSKQFEEEGLVGIELWGMNTLKWGLPMTGDGMLHDGAGYIAEKVLTTPNHNIHPTTNPFEVLFSVVTAVKSMAAAASRESRSRLWLQRWVPAAPRS